MSSAWLEDHNPEGNVSGLEGFSGRLFDAWLIMSRREGKGVSQPKIAKMITARLGLPKPLSPSAVNKWFNEGVIPDVPKLAVLAEILGPEIDPGWLAFGELSKAPPPRNLGGGGSFPQPPEDDG